MGSTDHYSLTTIGSTGDDRFSDNNYKYTRSDRELIDLLLYRAANHRHIGGVDTVATPSVAPELTLFATGGTLQSNLRAYYKYTLVDVNGFESAPSPESYVDTPAAITSPGAPTLATFTTGGVLLAGNYFYALSAYNDANTYETKAPSPNSIIVPNTTSTNKNRVTFPTLPVNADGFNIYRKSPGSTQYYYLISVSMAGATPPGYYDDTGAVDENCARTLPASNTTMSTNRIEIEYPGATPVVPAGYTWKIYRTFTLNDYTRSLLYHVVEETSPGIIDIDYVDLGYGTTDGSPPSTARTLDVPAPVNLNNGVEVQNRLPIGNVLAFPHVVTFSFSGPVSLVTGTMPWVCEFPVGRIISCRASLGRGYSPAAQSVIVDVIKWNSAAATPSWGTIYPTSTKPRVLVGSQFGTRYVPDVNTLVAGDALTVDISQAGGGATPTDEDLVISIMILAQFSASSSDLTLWE